MPRLISHTSVFAGRDRLIWRQVLRRWSIGALLGGGVCVAMNTVNAAALSVPTSSARLTSVYQPIELPDLGSVPSLFQQQQERKIGEAILREINQQAPVFEDPWLQDELMALFRQINAEAGLAGAVRPRC